MVDKILSAVSPIALVEKLNEIIDELKKVGGSYLFHHEWADAIVNDLNWLRADTFSWQDGTVYSNAYNHLVTDYQGGTSQTETVGSYTITYKLSTDGHKITTDETNVANIYNESGVAWYYVLDTANQRFKLPRENPARELLIKTVPVDVIGTSNITTYTGSTVKSSLNGKSLAFSHRYDGYTNFGVVYDKNDVSNYTPDNSSIGFAGLADFEYSTGIYKGKQYLYFYVGQFTQTATEQTAGLNSELFNGKVDLNLNNMNPSQTAKTTIVGWGMPDYSSAYTVSIPTSSNPSTATQNGYIVIRSSTTGADKALIIEGINTSYNFLSQLCATVPIAKGQQWYLIGTYDACQFVPLKGGV